MVAPDSHDLWILSTTSTNAFAKRGRLAAKTVLFLERGPLSQSHNPLITIRVINPVIKPSFNGRTVHARHSAGRL
jgi:hypothetical protein